MNWPFNYSVMIYPLLWSNFPSDLSVIRGSKSNRPTSVHNGMSNMRHYSAIRSIELNLGGWDQIKNTEPLGASIFTDSIFIKGPEFSILAYCSNSTGTYMLGPRNHQSISFRLAPRAMQEWKLLKNNDFIWKNGGNQAEVTCIYPQGLSLDVRNNISSIIQKHSLSNCHNSHWRSLIISVHCSYLKVHAFIEIYILYSALPGLCKDIYYYNNTFQF